MYITGHQQREDNTVKPIVDIKGESHTKAYQRFTTIHSHPEHKQICDEWHTYSKFKEWYTTHYEEGKHFVNVKNKFSPTSCGFVSPALKWVFNHVKPTAGTNPTTGGYNTTFRTKVSGPYATQVEAHVVYLMHRNDYISTISDQLPEHLRTQVATPLPATPSPEPATPQYSVEQDVPLAQGYLGKSESAKQRGIEFALSFDKYRELVNATRCQITDTPFVTHEKTHHHSRTLDRIDCEQGYTDENTIAVTKEVNVLKNIIAEQPEGTINADAFQKLAAFMLANQSIIDNMDIRPRNQL